MRALKTLCVLLILTIILGMVPAMAAKNMPYYIHVDCTNNIVTVYSTLDDSVVRQMICSTGVAKWPSPRGTYIMPEPSKSFERTEWYKFQDGYGKYGSRIKGNWLFHSYLFWEKDEDTVKWESVAGLGTNASHGCIRLYIEDAKWICDNCLPGTEVKLFDNDKRLDYLKELLLTGTYSVDSGISYEEYASMASDDTEMGYYSKGENVTALQERMIELGLYAGEADGSYGADMVRTVKAIQTSLGRKVTGVVDQELLDLLMSDEAPISTLATLKKGAAGPAVTSMQTSLARLGLYTAEINGEFDDATETAVKQFQRLCKYEETGVATGILQQNMADSIDKLNDMYGEGQYALIFEERYTDVAEVVSEGKLNMRHEKSTDSYVLERLAPGTKVSVVEKQGDWTKVSYEGETGYVSTAYLTFSQETDVTPKYVAADETNPALDTTGIESTVNVIRAQEVTWGVVNIDQRLNVRSKPDSESKLAFILAPGTPVRILAEKGSWAYVAYADMTGYAKTTYFDKTRSVELTSTASVVANVAAVEEELDSTYYVQVIAEEGADLYSLASESGEVKAHMPMNSRAQVLLGSAEWTQVRYENTTGYVKNSAIISGTLTDIENGLEDMENIPEEPIEEEIADESEDFADDETLFAEVASESPAGLNMRAEASADSEILCVLENGAMVEVLSDDGEWSNITFEGMTGYVMSKFLAYPEEETENFEDTLPEDESFDDLFADDEPETTAEPETGDEIPAE